MAHTYRDGDVAVDAEVVIACVVEAASAILQIYDADDASWGVVSKSDESPLTKADLAANAVICERLAKAYPAIPIVSEETKQAPYDERRGWRHCWCVDPLDGTKEFIKRNGQFTVNVALLEAGTPVLGCVHVPCTGETYFAVKGAGAFLRRKADDGDGATPAADEAIACAKFSWTDPNLVVIGSRSHKGGAASEAFITPFRSPSFASMGSSLKFLEVARGAAHVYPRFAPTCEWDTAAAHCVLSEAGGRIVQAGLCDGAGAFVPSPPAASEEGGDAGGLTWQEALQQNKDVRYNKEQVLNPFFVAYGACSDPPPVPE